MAFINGIIYTMDDGNSVKEAMIIRDGKITDIGSTAQILSAFDEGGEVIDLKGQTALPGICDSHMHIQDVGGKIGIILNLFGKTKKEVLDIVAARVKILKKGEWIIGRGWNQTKWDDDSLPTKEDLDAVAPDNPVNLIRYCCNAFWCNSLALKFAKITPTLVKEKNFQTNEKGEAYGIVAGKNCKYIQEAIPGFTKEECVAMIKEAEYQALSVGITTLMDKGAGRILRNVPRHGRQMIEVTEEMHKRDDLKVRVYQAIIAYDETLEDIFEKGYKEREHNGKFTMRCVKLWDDGAFGPRSAWITEDYVDQPGNRGEGEFTDEELVYLFKRADDMGLQIAIHTIGDAATTQALDCYEKAFADSLHKDRRFIIDHCIIPNENDVERIIKYNIIASVQFCQFSSDMDTIGGVLPKKLLSRFWPWKEIMDKGGVVVNGSDAPADPMNPFEGLYVAVTRKSLSGVNLVEEPPYQKISRLEALKTYTINSAYCRYQEKFTGSLEVDKDGDLIIIDKDYFRCDEEDIKNIKVIKSYIDGEEVYAID